MLVSLLEFPHGWRHASRKLTYLQHLCRISEKYKNAFSLTQIWTPILTQKVGSPSELRGYCDFVQGMIMNAYDLFEEPRPEEQQPTVFELE
jgi:hypothetical protein